MGIQILKQLINEYSFNSLQIFFLLAVSESLKGVVWFGILKGL